MYFWIEAIDNELHFFTRDGAEFRNFGSGSSGLNDAMSYIFGNPTALNPERGLFLARLKKQTAELIDALGERWVVVELVLEDKPDAEARIVISVADPSFTRQIQGQNSLSKIVEYLRLPPPVQVEVSEDVDGATGRTTLLRLGKLGP